MTDRSRSRRVRAGLAGLSVVSALGAAVGLGLTTHPSDTSSHQTVTRPSRTTPVTQQGNTLPQATTKGS